MTSSTSKKYYLKNKKLNKIEKNKAEKDGLAIGSQINDFANLGWESLNKTDLELRLKWYGMFWRPKTPGKFMLRLRIPNGILNSNQLKVIASIVARYGEDGTCDITTRQNLQLRGVLLSDLQEILIRLNDAGISTIQSGFDNPRNITGNALAGIDKNEIIDTRPFTYQLQEYLTNGGDGNEEFSNLPRKWNTAIAGSKDNFLLHNDLVFHPVELNGEMGFGIWLGGILSSQLNKYAIPLDAWIQVSEICKITGIIIKIWRDNGERDKRPKGRFRFYLDQIGIENFRKVIEEEFGPLKKDPGSKFSENPRSIFGIHAQKQDNLNYAGLHIPVGRLSSEDLQDLAELSINLGDQEIRLTEDQNVIISGIHTSNIEKFKKVSILKRFPIEPGSFSGGTVSCTGNTYCSFAITNTKDIANKLAKELDHELEIDKEIKIHWTGCPNSCGQAYMGAIGLTGKKAKNLDGIIVDAYDVSIGGSQGAVNEIGEIMHKSVPKDKIKDVIKNILLEKYSAKVKQKKLKLFSIHKLYNWLKVKTLRSIKT